MAGQSHLVCYNPNKEQRLFSFTCACIYYVHACAINHCVYITCPCVYSQCLTHMYMYNKKYKRVTQVDMQYECMYMCVNHCVYTFLSLSNCISLSLPNNVHTHSWKCCNVHGQQGNEHTSITQVDWHIHCYSIDTDLHVPPEQVHLSIMLIRGVGLLLWWLDNRTWYVTILTRNKGYFHLHVHVFIMYMHVQSIIVCTLHVHACTHNVWHTCTCTTRNINV